MTGILNLLLGNRTPAATDPYFNYNTLLLPGNGTNGAQNNTFLDSSSNNFTITRNGDTTQGTFSPFSQTGWSNYLSNATGSYIVAANNSSYVFGTGDFTVEFWVYWPQPSTSSETRLMAIGSDYPSSGLGLVIYRASGDTCKARVLGNSTGGTEYTIASGASDWANKWVHMAVTRSGSTIRTFLNGTLITSDSNSSDLNGTNGIQFGRYTGGGDLFTGYLSNVRLTKGGALYTASFTPPTAPLTTTVLSGTVGFLGFQSNRFVDNSGNNITLTPTGTPSVQAFSPFAPTAAYSASTVGGSGYFDGSGDYLSVADNAAFDFGSGDFTIECWAYTDTFASQYNVLVCQWNTSYSFIFRITSSLVGLYINVGNPYTLQDYSASVTNTTGQWNHFCVTRSGSTLTFYKNGASIGTSSISATITNAASDLTVGVLGDLNATTYHKGYISGMRLIKGTAVAPTITTPPTAVSGTSLLLNFTNAGIIDNTAKNDLQTVGNAQISTAQSKFGGGSMAFDGSGDWLTGRNTNLLYIGSGDFTIEGWVYLNAIGSEKGVVSQFNSSGSGPGWTLYIKSNNVLEFYGGSGTVTVTGTTALSATTWTHFAVVRSGSTITIYVNGTAGGSATNSSFSDDTTGLIYVGGRADNSSLSLNGYIDDLRITKGIARYTSNFTPQTSQWQDQ